MKPILTYNPLNPGIVMVDEGSNWIRLDYIGLNPMLYKVMSAFELFVHGFDGGKEFFNKIYIEHGFFIIKALEKHFNYEYQVELMDIY